MEARKRRSGLEEGKQSPKHKRLGHRECEAEEWKSWQESFKRHHEDWWLKSRESRNQRVKMSPHFLFFGYIYTRAQTYTWLGLWRVSTYEESTQGESLCTSFWLSLFFPFLFIFISYFPLYSGYLHLALVWFFFRRLPVGYTKWCWDIMALAWRKLSKASLPSFITLFSFYIFFPLYIFFKAVFSFTGLMGWIDYGELSSSSLEVLSFSYIHYRILISLFSLSFPSLSKRAWLVCMVLVIWHWQIRYTWGERGKK